MPDLIKNNYQQTGGSTNTNALGMRAMQERAYQMLPVRPNLLKTPPP